MSVQRRLALHFALGFAVAAVFVAGLLLADPGGMGALLRAPDAGWLPLFLLWLFTGLTFGVAQCATALGCAEAPDEDRGSLVAIPVPVPVRSPRNAARR
ncbi:hypothetical protein [Paracraurococcus lichenis]|uniref:Uncharacterized protein n=1 Tax=Paracraurococcus lichenis TaxID=3064888 RepID=A0ABT9E003_9PROT|nr:hypothetical protein [Paracraurococcus sp. LOR1-02]MDO9709487.1 hypothetical protein [Paracraurococcus sp. LOR1-02]